MEIGNILRYRLREKWSIAPRSRTINARLMKPVMERGNTFCRLTLSEAVECPLAELSQIERFSRDANIGEITVPQPAVPRSNAAPTSFPRAVHNYR